MKRSLYTALILALLSSNSAIADTSNGLPDKSKTPGATNTAVTQTTIASTICVAGYTKTVRPPNSYTHNLKVAQLAAGYTQGGDIALTSYEEDHLIPLEVGGSPTSVKNLWPEPYNVAYGAHEKDQLENYVHKAVCDGQMTLVFGQRLFSTNWIAAYKKYL